MHLVHALYQHHTIITFLVPTICLLVCLTKTAPITNSCGELCNTCVYTLVCGLSMSTPPSRSPLNVYAFRFIWLVFMWRSLYTNTNYRHRVYLELLHINHRVYHDCTLYTHGIYIDSNSRTRASRAPSCFNWNRRNAFNSQSFVIVIKTTQLCPLSWFIMDDNNMNDNVNNIGNDTCCECWFNQFAWWSSRPGITNTWKITQGTHQTNTI